MKKILLVLLCVFIANTSVSAQRARTQNLTDDSQIDSQNRATGRSAARSSAPARSANTASAPARSANTASTPARSANKASTPARSATRASTTPTRSTGRSAARSSAPTRSTARSAGSNQASLQPTAINQPENARAARTTGARTGVGVVSTSTPSATATATATATSSVADALKAAGYNSSTGVSTAKTTEQVAQQIANETTCKDTYIKCMDNFCNDTDPDSIMGRCLCSSTVLSFQPKEKQRIELLATINQLQDQINYLPLAKQKSQLDGTSIEESLKSVTLDQLREKGMVPSAADAGIGTDIYNVYLGSSSKNTVQKEGDELLKEAQNNCQTLLDVCPEESKERVKGSYATLAGNSCRAYGRSIDNKLQELALTQQKASRAFQAESLKYDLTTTNKLDSQKCSSELYTCMESDMICGKSFEKCYTDVRLEQLKQNCTSVLNQCQGANKNDAIWTTFKAVALTRAQLSNQQCYEQSKVCIERECGSDMSKCMDTGTINVATVQKRAQTACGDTIDRCIIRVKEEGKTVTSASIWDTLINDLIRSSLTDASEQTVYTALESCMKTACGDGFINCRSDSDLELKKSACSSQLARLSGGAAGTTGAPMWTKFKGNILMNYGWTNAECIAKVEENVFAMCGSDLTGCTADKIDAAKTAVTDAPAKLCGWTNVDDVWTTVSAKFKTISNANILTKNYKECQEKGNLFTFNIESNKCDCKYEGLKKNCLTYDEYVKEYEAEIVRTQGQMEWNKVKTELSISEAEMAMEEERIKAEMEEANKRAKCLAVPGAAWGYKQVRSGSATRSVAASSVPKDQATIAISATGFQQMSLSESTAVLGSSTGTSLEGVCCQKGVEIDGTCSTTTEAERKQACGTPKVWSNKLKVCCEKGVDTNGDCAAQSEEEKKAECVKTPGYKYSDVEKTCCPNGLTAENKCHTTTIKERKKIWCDSYKQVWDGNNCKFTWYRNKIGSDASITLVDGDNGYHCSNKTFSGTNSNECYLKDNNSHKVSNLQNLGMNFVS